jgi:hypothetical protein
VPQLKNLLEISFTITSFRSEGGEKVEAKMAERKAVTAAIRSLSTGVKEGEREDPSRVH